MRNARSGATPSFPKRSTASLASLSTQADFISDGYRLSPNRRLAHQPRFGCALSSLPVLEITGVGGGALVRGCGADAPPVAAHRARARPGVRPSAGRGVRPRRATRGRERGWLADCRTSARRLRRRGRDLGRRRCRWPGLDRRLRRVVGVRATLEGRRDSGRVLIANRREVHARMYVMFTTAAVALIGYVRAAMGIGASP